jgi:hypothetical protein
MKPHKVFTVRIFVNGSAPMVINGGIDAFSVFLQTREPSGSGYTAIPEKRIEISMTDLRELAPGSGADFEYKHVVTSDYF